MSEKFRIGIVGAGRGRSYFSPFAAMAETEVIAICDLDQSALDQIGNQYQIKQRFTNYDDLLDQVDIVVLATPENLHVPQSVQALQAGKHVISEVTAAVSLDQCTELVQAVESSSAQYMMAENLCYQKSNILIRNMVQQGVFGDIMSNSFIGKRSIQRHQMIYQCLGDSMGNEIHALTISTYTLDEYSNLRPLK